MRKQDCRREKILSRNEIINANELVQKVFTFENERKKRLKKLLLIETGVFFLIAVSLILAWIIYSHNPSHVGSSVCLCFAGVFILFGLNQISVSNCEFQIYLKRQCFPQILLSIKNIKYDCGSEIISNSKCRASELFAKFEKRCDDDSFKGKYKGIRYEISETCLQDVFRYYGYDFCKNVFNGIIINLEANKDIKATTIAASGSDINIKNRNLTGQVSALILLVLGFGFCWTLRDCLLLWVIIIIDIVIFYICREDIKKMKKNAPARIKLEDPVFNKKYKAYSFDEVEGRYLLTTGFMERFNNIKTAFGTNNINCSFYDRYLMIAIKTNRDLFEIGSLFIPLKNPKYIRNFLKELDSIFELIDYFKLDEKTGL